MAIGAFATGLYFRHNGPTSFLAGLVGVGLLWCIMAVYLDSSTGSVITSKVAAILPTKTVGWLIVVTAVIGGLVGGFATMTGGIITSKRKSRY
jgi:hypothetical protein